MAYVLLVEDDDDCRELYSFVLKEAGHFVRSVADGGEAIRALAVMVPDVLVTDIFMPVRDGLEVVREARARHPRAKVIAMSGGSRYDTYDVLSHARDFGADVVLHKPLAPRELVRAVAALGAAARRG